MIKRLLLWLGYYQACRQCGNIQRQQWCTNKCGYNWLNGIPHESFRKFITQIDGKECRNKDNI